MLYSIKDREDLKKLDDLASLQTQVKAVRLQDKLCTHNFDGDMKKVLEPATKSLEKTSQAMTKTKTETFKQNMPAIENLNNKLLEILNDRGIIARYFLSPLSKITNLENTTQFKLVKVSSSNRVIDLLIHNSIPITLHDSLLTFCDTGKIFELKEEFLKMITN